MEMIKITAKHNNLCTNINICDKFYFNLGAFMINNMIIVNSLIFLSISMILYFKKSFILKIRNVERYLGFFNLIATFVIIRGSDPSWDTTILLFVCFFNILLLHDFGALINSLSPKLFKLSKNKYYVSKYIIYNGQSNDKHNPLIDIKQLYFKKLIINLPKDSEYIVEKSSLEKYFIHEGMILPSLYMCFGLIQIVLTIV